MSQNETVNQKYTTLIAQYNTIQNDSRMKNSLEFQKDLSLLIDQFELIDHMITTLDLFSDNEFLEEINVNYLPFLNIDYYLGELYMARMCDNGVVHVGVEYKVENLNKSKDFYNRYLSKMKDLELLNPLQLKQRDGYVLSRDEKIQQYRYEKELKLKIQSIDLIHDEDEKRRVYIDEFNLYTIKSLTQLELITMEIQVLKNRPVDSSHSGESKTVKTNSTDYSTRLDKIPQNQQIHQLVKNGRILQPFTITREELKSKVFGTGQVLPSMTVEEYLDYELANGKMQTTQQQSKTSDDEDEEDNEDEELKKREWDDWKDDNPKGLGNTMNLG